MYRCVVGGRLVVGYAASVVFCSSSSCWALLCCGSCWPIRLLARACAQAAGQDSCQERAGPVFREASLTERDSFGHTANAQRMLHVWKVCWQRERRLQRQCPAETACSCIEEEELDGQRSEVVHGCGYKLQRIRAVASWKSSWTRLIGGTNSWDSAGGAGAKIRVGGDWSEHTCGADNNPQWSRRGAWRSFACFWRAARRITKVINVWPALLPWYLTVGWKFLVRRFLLPYQRKNSEE